MGHRFNGDNIANLRPAYSNYSPPYQLFPLRALGLGQCLLAPEKRALKKQKLPGWGVFVSKMDLIYEIV